MALRFGEEGHVCVSNDYELGYQFSQPFTGFDSCHVGNPLAVPEAKRSSAPSTWPKTCPPGYSQHLAMVDDGCEINFCLKAGVLNDEGLIPIKRPPFIRMPVEASSGLTVALFTTSGKLWVRDENAPQQWKVIDPDSKEFIQILTDSGLVNTTDFASMDLASEPLIDPAFPGGGADPSHAEGLSPGAVAGIGIGSLFLGAVVAVVIMLGIKLGYRAKKKPAASLGGVNPVGYQNNGNLPPEQDV